MPMPSRRGRPEKPYVPPARAWRAAALGAGLGAYSALSFLATRIDSPLGSALDMLLTLLAGALIFLVAWTLAGGLLALLRVTPPVWAGAVAGCVTAVALFMYLTGSHREAVLFALLLVLPPAMVGGAVGLTIDRRFRGRSVAVFLILSLLLTVTEVWWLATPGFARPAAARGQTETVPAPIGGASPAESGPYEVRTLTYGSGTDARRPEYGERAALKTDPVDAGDLLPDWSGLRSWYWGFGADQLPIGGRVWYPTGEGLFPLVLMLHGNHAMSAPSENGYAYLGQLLASRGYIVASVDENFLGMSAFAGTLTAETGARAWLLLQHLAAWQRWSAAVGTPFFRRVDMGNIALVGHSRGGEAAYLAAVFNDLPYWPDNAAIPLGFHFKIKAVAALASTDGQYRPSDKLPALSGGVSYLALHGSLDADVATFSGLRQYQRVRPAEGTDAFKAAVYIDGANHTQFNTVWGRHDWAGPAALLLNTRPAMAPPEQRQVAGVYLSAFLDATLRGNLTYRPLFRDPRAGAAWLPAAKLVSRYEGSSFRLVSGYEEDLDLLTTTAPGGAQRGEHLSGWREQATGPEGQNTAVALTWKLAADKVPTYTAAVPENLAQAWNLGYDHALTFALADARPLQPGLKPLDLTVELVTADGTAARLPLSHWADVPVRQGRRLTKLGALEPALLGTPEPILQTYTLPLADFAKGPLDPAKVRAVRFRFDRSPAGAVLLDDIGFVRLP